MSNANVYPRNVGELAASQEWRRRMLAKIRTFKVSGLPEDHLQAIYLLMLERQDPEGRGLDYIERWDATKGGSFANWVITFVFNFMVKVHRRSNSEGGRAIEGALPIESRSKEEGAQQHRVVFDDEIGEEAKAQAAVEVQQICEQAAAEFDFGTPAYSWVTYSDDGKSYTVRNVKDQVRHFHGEVDEEFRGETFKRDHSTVLRMLVDNVEPKAIAAAMKVSPQFVYDLIRDLRNHPAIRQLRGQFQVATAC